MMNGIFNKRIPTLFGLLAIIIGIGITSLLTQQGVIFTGKASPSNEPQNILVSNVTDTSFTLTYTTSDSVLGSLNTGQTTNLGTTFTDDRDKTVSPHNIHVITAKNLKPKTSYLFSITSGQDTFLNNGVLFNVNTGPALDSTTATARDGILGKLIMPDGSTPKEAIVYINIAGAQTLSTLMKPDGTYDVQLALLRNSDLSSYYAVPKDTNVKISAFEESLISQAFLSFEQISLIPTITLSQNYDFTVSNSPVSLTPSITATPSAALAFPTATPSSKLNTDPQILTPKKDQGFSDAQPQFKGTAQPNQEVDITIHSDTEITAKTTTDASGNWTYRPDSTLTPGDHTISITTRDIFGILKTITQQFTVYAAGTQVNQSATPSATLTPITTPSAMPTVTPTITIAPVIIATETPTLTPILTITPTATVTAVPSPTAVLPASGNSSGSMIGFISASFMIIGSLLFIFTRLKI